VKSTFGVLDQVLKSTNELDIPVLVIARIALGSEQKVPKKGVLAISDPLKKRCYFCSVCAL